jgi:hypothetical protein
MAENIGLPPERYQQVQQLSEAEGKTMAETVSDLVCEAIAQKRLPPGLPGWRVELLGNHVQLEHAEADLSRCWGLASARVIAQHLGRLSSRTSLAKPFESQGDEIKLERRGAAVRLTHLSTGRSRTLARSVGADLAHLIHRAVARS